MSTVEEIKKGGKQAYGTHKYPDHLSNIDNHKWDVIVVGAGPAGIMLTVSVINFDESCSIMKLTMTIKNHSLDITGSV